MCLFNTDCPGLFFVCAVFLLVDVLYRTSNPPVAVAPSSRSVEINGYTAALRDQYINTSMSTPYQLLPHLFSYAAQSGLLAPQPRSLDPRSHPLVLQLVAAEDLAPLATPMLIEDG